MKNSYFTYQRDVLANKWFPLLCFFQVVESRSPPQECDWLRRRWSKPCCPWPSYRRRPINRWGPYRRASMPCPPASRTSSRGACPRGPSLFWLQPLSCKCLCSGSSGDSKTLYRTNVSKGKSQGILQILEKQVHCMGCFLSSDGRMGNWCNSHQSISICYYHVFHANVFSSVH